jgi:flagellar biosynthesis protein FliR
MPISFDERWFVLVWLASLRTAGLLLLTPLLPSRTIPGSIRFLVVLALAVWFTGIPFVQLGRFASGIVPSFGELIVASMSEVLLGSAMGLGVAIAFGAFSVAGKLLDIQVGYSIAQTFDPLSGANNSPLTALFSQVGVIYFFLFNGHEAIFRMLLLSFSLVTVGSAWSTETVFFSLSEHSTRLLQLGFALAAPVAFCLLLTEAALGLVARSMPQMNILTMGIGVKVLIATLALSVWFGTIGSVMRTVYASIGAAWESLFSSSILSTVR